MIGIFGKLALAVVALALSTTMALAGLSLDAAKKQGLVGERPDGMLGIVASEPSPDVDALVDTINAERAAKYESIAAKNGTDLDKVKALAGQKLIDNTPAGQYVMNAAGVWQVK